MNALALQISEQLTSLPIEERKVVMDEVREHLLDVQAQEVHDSVQSGEMETYSSSEVIADLKQKYAL